MESCLSQSYFRLNMYILDTGLYLFCTEDMWPGYYRVISTVPARQLIKTHNQIFGEQIASVVDKVILIGEKRTKPIYDGLISKGYKKENIYISNDVREAYTILNKLKDKKDLYALFENDLPDAYTEK